MSTSFDDDDGSVGTFSSLQSGYTAASTQSGSTLGSSSTKKSSKSSGDDSTVAPDPDTQLNVGIQVKACRNLPIQNEEIAAPFVQVQLGDKLLHTTKPVFKDLNPKYSSTQSNAFALTCTVQELIDAQGVTFLIVNKDFLDSADDEQICKVRIPPKVFYNPTGELREFKLKQAKKDSAIVKATKGSKSYIRLRMKSSTSISPKNSPHPSPKSVETKSPQLSPRSDNNNNNKQVSSSSPQATPPPPTQRKKNIPSELGYDTNYQQSLAKTATNNGNNNANDTNYHKDTFSRKPKIPPLTIEIVSSTRKIVDPEAEKVASDVYTRVTINGEDLTQALISFKSARHKAPLFESVVFHNLKISNTKEDMILADEIKKHKNLRKAHFFYLKILSQTNSKTSMIPPILESVGELPLLEELEVRTEGERKELPKIFLKYICQYSKSMKSLLLANVLLSDENMQMLFSPTTSKLESLVLWNIKIDFKQLRMICDDLYNNTKMTRLEIWCSDLGQNFGILLAEMLEANKSLETLVVSHVGMYGASCIALMDALKTKNSTLRHLTLLSIAYNDRDTVSKAVMQMMNDNKTLKSLSVTYESMKEEDCLQVSQDMKRNMLLRKLLQHKKELEEQKSGCEVL